MKTLPGEEGGKSLSMSEKEELWRRRRKIFHVTQKFGLRFLLLLFLSSSIIKKAGDFAAFPLSSVALRPPRH